MNPGSDHADESHRCCERPRSAQPAAEPIAGEMDVRVTGTSLVLDFLCGVPGERATDLVIHVRCHAGVVDQRAAEFVDQVLPGDHQRDGGWGIEAGDAIVEDAVHLGGQVGEGVAE